MVKVRITGYDSSLAWYKNKIGEVFEVAIEKGYSDNFFVYKNKFAISESNCVVID